jgi:hypothetical protein
MFALFVCPTLIRLLPDYNHSLSRSGFHYILFGDFTELEAWIWARQLGDEASELYSMNVLLKLQLPGSRSRSRVMRGYYLQTGHGRFGPCPGSHGDE